MKLAKMTTPQAPKAILYSRFSSSQQAVGDSLRRQEELAQKFCTREGLELIDSQFQDLGFSGWKQHVKREGLESLLMAVENGTIPSGTWILVEATDRLSRQGWDHVVSLVKSLVSTGCTFVTLDNNQIYTNNNIQDLMSALPLMISADLAFKESQRKSQLLRAAKTNKRTERVIQGNQPFWIDVVDGKPVLNDKAPIARRIVDLALDGIRPLAIVRAFNTEGLKSPKDKEWNVAVIRSILKNTILYGAKTYFESRDGKYKDVETVAGLYPKICSLAEFEQITIKKKKDDSSYNTAGAFSNLLKCRCGRALVTKQKRGDDIYKVCSGVINETCKYKGYYKNIDFYLMKWLGSLSYQEIAPQQNIVDNSSRITELEQLLIDLETMRVDNKGKTKILQRIYEDIEEAESELEVLQAQSIINEGDKTVTLQHAFEFSDNPTKQNMILRRFINVIECKKESGTTIIATVKFKSGSTYEIWVHHETKLKGGKDKGESVSYRWNLTNK
ncbi:TPA: recombinase family protein [Aeromonas salmonicida]|nr:recombinase family protein [Aeromonas salmonicida]HEH9424186.1 recombinase family protein [Aeromonas salmonicida]HEH9437432.1 recombinase family protein [Aeromonas salmonicida]